MLLVNLSGGPGSGKSTTAGLFYNWIGHYPRIHIGVPAGTPDDYQIVTSDKTQTDFQNHKSEPLNLLKKN